MEKGNLVIAMTIPMTDVLSSYRQAALRIRDLRRKGIACHLEQKAHPAGPYLEIVCDKPRGERRDVPRRRHMSALPETTTFQANQPCEQS